MIDTEPQIQPPEFSPPFFVDWLRSRPGVKVELTAARGSAPSFSSELAWLERTGAVYRAAPGSSSHGAKSSTQGYFLDGLLVPIVPRTEGGYHNPMTTQPALT